MFCLGMQIQNNYSKYLYTSNYSRVNKNFGSADNINLKYIEKNRMYILPKRMQDTLLAELKKGNPDNLSLRDLHLKTYAEILDCNSLDELKNKYSEFGEVLQANAVIKHKSPNVKKIMEVMSLEDLSLFLVKERWGKLKTTDEIAKELGLKDRSAINWFLDKIQLPRFEKNYTALLRASDEALNKELSDKIKSCNQGRQDAVWAHNKKIAEQSKDIQREISLRAWERLPHVKAALSDMSKEFDKKVLMSKFWAKYPDYAKEYGEAKRIVAEELRQERKK